MNALCEMYYDDYKLKDHDYPVLFNDIIYILIFYFWST